MNTIVGDHAPPDEGDMTLGQARVCAVPCGSQRARRHGAILDAAEMLFMEQGYDRTSLAEIVRQSGGSMATLYDLFGNKQGLLRAIAARWRDEELDCGVHCVYAPDKSRTDALIEYAIGQTRRMNAPRAVALMRMVVSECLRDRDFALQTYHDLHLPVIAELADQFRAWNTQWHTRIDDPDAAANLFFSIITGDAMLSKLAGVEGSVFDEEQVRWRLKPFFAYFDIG